MNDKAVLRDLARRYAEIASLPIQEEKRRIWTEHFSLRSKRVPVVFTYGMWNAWCTEVFGDGNMRCEDPFFRGFERDLKLQIFHHEKVGDDYVQEPWVTLRAAVDGGWGRNWGVPEDLHGSGKPGEAAAFNPPIKDWSDMSKLRYTPHRIDEEKTRRDHERISDAIGDIIEINVDRSPTYIGFSADISTSIAKLRGLEQLMMDMYDSPEELHKLLAFMRDGILKNNQQAEDAGDYSLTSGINQAVPYAEELPRPKANSGPVKRKQLWGFVAAQEYTLISPEYHDEFLFQYQLPIMEKFGLVHYGCCEDLAKKIDMLRKLKNLRSIAVTPVADVRKCAEQIGRDYAISWRPNPTDVICCGFDEGKIRRIIAKGLDDSKGCCRSIHLKDVETRDGDISRPTRCVEIIRETVGKHA